MSQLITNLAVGSKIKFGKYQVYNETPESVVWQIANITADKITLVTEGIIDSRCFDGKEPTNTDGSGRNSYGNNRYMYSNIRNYLNRGTGTYTSQHQYDAPPSSANINGGLLAYDSKNGFLKDFSIDEVNSLMDTVRNPYIATIDDPGSNYTESVTDKVFLLEQGEVAPNSATTLALFKNEGQSGAVSSKAFKTPTTQCSTQVAAQGGTAGRTYWTSYVNSRSSGTLVSLVPISSTTAFTSSYAYANAGLVVGANVAPTTKVSNAMDSDSCYSIVYDVASVAPTLNITDQALGNISVGFSTTYQVNDGNVDDILTITEDFVDPLNGNVINNIRTINNTTRLTDYTMNIASIWDTLGVGSYKIRIMVEDNGGNTSSVYITFTKQIHLVVTGLDSTDYGNKYQPWVINYEIFGTGTVKVTETLDSNSTTSMSYYNATPATSIKRSIDLTNMVNWTIYEGSQAHTIHVEISQVNAGYPTGEFINKDITFTVIPKPADNNIPTLTVPQTAFGSLINGFSFGWTVSDKDVDNSMNTQAKLDGTQVIYDSSWTSDVYYSKDHTLDLSVIWNNISIGAHTITITATDGVSSPDPVYVTFTKKRDKLDVIAYGALTDTLAARIIPIVDIVMLKDTLDTVNVYVCNNAADATPSWESIGSYYGKPYTFINKTKTATHARVAVKIETIPYS